MLFIAWTCGLFSCILLVALHSDRSIPIVALHSDLTHCAPSLQEEKSGVSDVKGSNVGCQRSNVQGGSWACRHCSLSFRHKMKFLAHAKFKHHAYETVGDKKSLQSMMNGDTEGLFGPPHITEAWQPVDAAQGAQLKQLRRLKQLLVADID